MRLWITAVRIAWREGRASRLKFLFVIFGVAAGVGALTGVRGFSEAFLGALKRESRTLLAADLAIRQFSPLTPAQQEALDRYTSRGATLTPITETVSMMSAGTNLPPVLVSVKAVDPSQYPFYGKVELDPPQPLKQALTDSTIVVSDDLLVRLNIETGSMVKLGEQEFRVAGVVRREPDRMTGSLNVGPRVMISREGLERTGLMQFGSRASHRFLLRAPEPQFNLTAMQADLRKVFPEASVITARQTHPAITRALDRSTTFLSLVSLIALIVGALGVATSIHAHLQQRLDTIAVMKCVGARSSQIMRIYTLQTGMLALAGGVLGVGVGAGVQKLFPLLLRRYFQFEGGIGWSPAFALEGILTGVLVTLLFTLPPLLSIRQVRPALIFRREMAEARPSWRDRLRRQMPAAVAGAFILGGLGAIAGWLAESARLGTTFIAGLTISLVVLAGVAWLLLRLLKWSLRRVPFRFPVSVRHGVANVHRPGNHATSILVSLGIGVMFTLTIYLIQNSLLAEVAGAAPPNAPNVFMINITPSERDGVQALLDKQHSAARDAKGKPRLIPYVAARLLSVNGKALDPKEFRGHDRRYLLRTRQLTWVDALPEDARVMRGQWWTRGSKEPQVALSEQAAEMLHAEPGSILRWEATGRQFDTRLAAIYRVQQVGFGASGEILFNPKALEGFPAQYIGTARLRPGDVHRFQRDVFAKYPTVTVVNAADVLAIVQEVVDQVSMVVRFIAAFAIVAGAIILMATVAGTRFRRMREAAVLKTLGARRARLVGIFSVEFLIIGTVAGVMGAVLATLFTRVLLTRLLDAEFKFDMVPNLVTVVMTALLCVGAGWLASLRILNQKPLEVLRDE